MDMNNGRQPKMLKKQGSGKRGKRITEGEAEEIKRTKQEERKVGNERMKERNRKERKVEGMEKKQKKSQKKKEEKGELEKGIIKREMQGNPLKKTGIKGKGRKRERKMIKLNNGE